MGSCVSSTRQRRRSRKLSVAARKFRRKVSAAIADAPIIRGAGDAAGCFARHGVVHIEAPDSNVTLHLTKLQWQHSQMDAGSGKSLGAASPFPSTPLFHSSACSTIDGVRLLKTLQNSAQ